MTNYEFVNENLTNCDKEEIHLIGSIQSHGYLLGIHSSDYTIHYMSENIHELFKGNLLGEPISVVDKQIPSTVEGSTLQELLNTQIRSKNFDGYNPYNILINGNVYNLITHSSSPYIILEFEPADSKGHELEISSYLGDVLIHLNLSARSLNDIFGIAAIKLKELLQMDRVMIYSFDNDWSGEVIAEAKNNNLESFLGLHFPATDIPRQARILYSKNKTRHIADVHSPPINIVSKSNNKLDQSFCQLRSVSPIHIEYLKNMGVGASFSISLMHNGKLWGLVSCHHYSPKPLDYNTRKASEILSLYLSNIIELKTEKELSIKREESEKIIDTLDAQIKEDWNLKTGLTNHATNVSQLTSSLGAVVYLSGNMTCLGTTPPENDIKKLIDYLFSINLENDIYHTTNISQIFPSAANYSAQASGLIFLEISKELKECIIFFKPEQIENVTWAGKPEKIVKKEEDGSVSLSPRKSFEKWETVVSKTSVSWQDYELEAVKMLKERVLAYFRQRNNEIRRLNEKLSLAYDELNTFSYTLSHDLKTPLNNIHAYLELYVEDEGINLEENLYLKKVMSNTELMQNMITEVMAYSKATREDVKKEKVLVFPIIERIISQLENKTTACNITNNIDDRLELYGNATMLFQIFFNLIENSVKYRSKDRECLININALTTDDTVEFTVEDNGIGIEEKEFNNVFRLFKRANKNPEIKGSGVGLSIVKKLTLKLGGTISFTSTVGEGSVFKIVFNKLDNN